MSNLAILNGEKRIQLDTKEMFHWPIVNQAMRDATIKVLDDGTMSGIDITKEFEQQYAAAIKKVTENHEELLPGDKQETVATSPQWGLSKR